MEPDASSSCASATKLLKASRNSVSTRNNANTGGCVLRFFVFFIVRESHERAFNSSSSLSFYFKWG